MYVKRLHVRNLRSIRESDLEFRYPGDRKSTGETNNVNLLLGDNGTGKTTLLGGIAMVVLARVLEGSGFRPYFLVRRGAEEEGSSAYAELLLQSEDMAEGVRAPQRPVASHLMIRLRGTHHLLDWRDKPRVPESGPEGEAVIEAESLEGENLSKQLYEDRGAGWVLMGYGATRRVQQSESFDRSETERSRSVRFRRVANLFEEHLALAPLAAWFPQLSRARRMEVTDLLNRMLPDEIRFPGKRSEDDNFVFEHEGEEVPFGALSDGYRAYIALAADMLYNLDAASRPAWRLDQIPGVVLIDEIDLHLHPSWQRQVLAQLANALPRLQFIVSSHSAIVAGTVPDESLFVLKRQVDGGVTASNPEESIYGKTADEILLSSYFGLRTTRAPGVVDEMRKLSLNALQGDSKAAMELLRRMALGGERRPPEQAPPAPQLRTPPSERAQKDRLTAALTLQMAGVVVSVSSVATAPPWNWVALGAGVFILLGASWIFWAHRGMR